MISLNCCCLPCRWGKVSWNEILCAPFGLASNSSYLQLNLTRSRISTNSGPQLRPMWKDQGIFELRRKGGQKLCWLIPRAPSFFLRGVQSTCFCLELITGEWFEPCLCLTGRRLIIQEKSRNWCLSFPPGKGPTSQSVIGYLSRVFGVESPENRVFKAQAWRVDLFYIVVLCPVTCHLTFSVNLFLFLVKISSKWSGEDLSVE